MFKVGDKAKLNDFGNRQGFTLVKKDAEYVVERVDLTRLYIKEAGIYYHQDYFKLANEKETKMKYTINEDNSTTMSFPCIRKGKVSGKLYFFRNSKDRGYGLDSMETDNQGTHTNWTETLPWSGSVTITQ